MINLYEIIKQINEQKGGTHKAPCSALYNEVMDEVTKQVQKEINELVRNGKVRFHKTINSVSFEVVKDINN